MKSVVWGFVLLPLLAATAAAEPLLRPHDRLAICGDGMTANLGYSVYVEDYLLMCQPVEGIDVAEFGWGGQSAAAFLARLDTDLLPFKPTVVMTCFGMNDGGNKALDAETARSYRQAQTDMVRALKKAGVREIIVGSPKCVDSFHYRRDPAQAAVYNKTLGGLADIDREVAAKEGVIYADVFGATMAAMRKAKARNGESYLFDSEDGYQPGDPCKLVMAYAFLKALGCTGDIGTITVDFAAGKAEASPGQRIVSFRDQKLTIENTSHPFWFPGYPSGQQPDPMVKCLPFDNELNRYRLVVKNLPTAETKVSWGVDDAYDYASDELGKGVNLAAAMSGPFGGQTQNVDNGVRNQQQQERIAGQALVQGNPDPQAAAKREALLQTAKSRLIPFQYTITLQPLAHVEKQPPGPIPVIVDTDMDGDCDDVGAVALLNSFMNRGEADLIACVTNTRNTELSSAATVQAINAYYGHPSIPIGVYHGEPGPATRMTSVLSPAPAGAYHGQPNPIGSHYTLQVHRRFAPDFPNDDKLPAGVDVYRKALAAAADGTVVIASLGLLQNLQDLVQSRPDAVSDLSGLELVRKKVRQLVVMANTVPEDAYVLSKWPTPILWTTFVGTTIYTGKSLAQTPEDNPVRLAYQLFGDEKYNALHDGRQSWDLTAAWLAVRGPGELWDVASGGYWKVDPPGGYGTWIHGPATSQGLVIPRMPIPEVTKLIESELSRRPKP